MTLARARKELFLFSQPAALIMDFVDTKSQRILVKINLPARKKDKNKHNQPGNKRVKSGFFCGAVRWVLLFI